MKLQRPENIEGVTTLINRYTNKGSVSNNYLLPSDLNSAFASDGLLYCHSDSNLYLFLEKPGGFVRLYYVLNDQDEIPSFDTDIPMMTEILFRGNNGVPENEITFLQNAGFCINLRRDQYSASALSTDGLPPKYAQSLETAKEAVGLFNGSFDKYSGDYIPEDDIKELFEEKRILCIVNEHAKLMGALDVSVTAKNAWISHIAVNPEFRRKGVADKLVRMYAQAAKERGASRLMLWVQARNSAAVSLYAKYGFKYTNKSTLSLIKE